MGKTFCTLAAAGSLFGDVTMVSWLCRRKGVLVLVFLLMLACACGACEITTNSLLLITYSELLLRTNIPPTKILASSNLAITYSTHAETST